MLEQLQVKNEKKNLSVNDLFLRFSSPSPPLSLCKLKQSIKYKKGDEREWQGRLIELKDHWKIGHRKYRKYNKFEKNKVKKSKVKKEKDKRLQIQRTE